MGDVSRRIEYFAYLSHDGNMDTIRFSRHFSPLAAERRYGDLSRLYKGGSSSDYYLTVYTREEMIKDLGAEYDIDFKNKIARVKRGESC